MDNRTIGTAKDNIHIWNIYAVLFCVDGIHA